MSNNQTPNSETPTLRDLLAGAALAGIASKVSSQTMPQSSREAVAKLAYQFADAMLAERGK